MDFRQLENFIEVSRQMSFTKAAKNLYISQQGISKSIKSLEEELGILLFYRTSSSIVLTEYGSCLLTYAQNMDILYKKAIDDIEHIKKHNKNELRIGIPHGLVNILPAEILTDYNHSHQGVSVRISEYSDFSLDEALLAGQIDIGFCIAPVTENGFAVHYVHHSQTYYMISQKHPLAGEKSIELRSLKNELFIGFGENNKGHDVLVERCRKAGFTPQMGMQTQDMQLIEEMCRQGMGVGFYVGDATATLPGLRIIPDSEADWSYDVCLTTIAGRQLNFAESEFLEAMKAW